MKKLTIITVSIAALFALGACTTNESGGGAASGASTGGVKPYPKDTCIVTDNDLDSMGGPVTLVHEGQEVKFCCKPCIKKFNANPAKYLAEL